eukprot:GHVU01093909.1.p1 GENE.GHVU01093909.1~~GHVU01093909.1.p1  ORF type:complete len:161 (-),score=6.39 GHVU01093909.1:306-788(-)
MTSISWEMSEGDAGNMISFQILCKYIVSIRLLSAVRELEELGDLVVLPNTTSLLSNGSALNYYWNSLLNPGHPNAAPAKGDIKATFSTCTITAFSLFIEDRNHFILCVVNASEGRVLVLDPMPGVVPVTVFSQLADIFGVVFGDGAVPMGCQSCPSQRVV